MSGRFWTDVELDLLRSMYPECHTADVAAWLDRGVGQCYQAAIGRGLRKSAEYLASDSAARILRGKQNPSMIGARFQKGLTPWNKGLSGVNGYSHTRFTAGHKPQTWVPVGTQKLTKDGYLERKVSDTGDRDQDWQSVHSLVWIAANGPIPPGHVVTFKPGKKTANADAITADDVRCLSRAELMRRNSYQTNRPPELAKLVQLKGAITRQVNRIAREAQEQA